MSLDLARCLDISSDGHAGLPMEDYREYVDPEFRAPSTPPCRFSAR